MFPVLVRVTPGAARPTVGGRWRDPAGIDRLVVRVTAPSEGGKANRAVEKAVADAFGLPRRSAQITAGGKSRLKIVALDPSGAASSADLAARLETLLGGRSED